MAKFVVNLWDVDGKAHQIPFEGKDAQKKADQLLQVIQQATRGPQASMLDLGGVIVQPGSQHAAFVAELIPIDPNGDDALKQMQEYQANRFNENLEAAGGPEQVLGYGPTEASKGQEIPENTKDVQVDHTQS